MPLNLIGDQCLQGKMDVAKSYRLKIKNLIDGPKMMSMTYYNQFTVYYDYDCDLKPICIPMSPKLPMAAGT